MIDLMTLGIGLAALVALVPLILGCAQCFHRFLGFKDDVRYNQDIESGLGSTQSIPASDGTLYPPADSVDTDSIKGITFDPLPDIVGNHNASEPALRPRVSTLVASENVRLEGSRYEIPRGHLFYVNEVGSGWFGQVLEGDAEKLRFGQTRTKVIVKVLKDDATAREQLQFLEEVRVYRELDHPNVLRFMGQCTETIPYLTVLENATNGDLKSYLQSNRENQESFLERGNLLKFGCEMSAGLACMHRHDFIHKDFAARNCLVTNDLVVKVGDYGVSEDVYKDDYMTVGEDLIPIRWMSPETITVQDGDVQVQEITRQSNIWSFGVALWELFMLGERPYNYMTNESVITQVIVERFQQLPEPSTPVSWKSKVYDVMKMCWQDERPDIDAIHQALQHLQTAVKDSITAEFDVKWKLLMDQKSQSNTQLISAQIEKEAVVNGSGPPTGQHEMVVKVDVLMEEEIAGGPHNKDLQELVSAAPEVTQNWTPSKPTSGDTFQMTSTPNSQLEPLSSYRTPPDGSGTTDVFCTAMEPSESDKKPTVEIIETPKKAESKIVPVSSSLLDDLTGADNSDSTTEVREELLIVTESSSPSPSNGSTLPENGRVLSKPDLIEDLGLKDGISPLLDLQIDGSDIRPEAEVVVEESGADKVEVSTDLLDISSGATLNGAVKGDNSSATDPNEEKEATPVKVSDSGFATSESFSLDLLVSGKHSDFSSSRKPLDLMEDISYRRRSLLARDQLGMLPTIPEDRVPSISDGSLTDLQFDSFDDSSVIQDSFEWDEDIGRQLVGMVQETTWDYSPRYGLELSDWSLDQSETSQLKKSRRENSSSSFGTNHRLAIASSVHISDESDEDETDDVKETSQAQSIDHISQSIQPQTAS